jgi:hypothetical protein
MLLPTSSTLNALNAVSRVGCLTYIKQYLFITRYKTTARMLFGYF